MTTSLAILLDNFTVQATDDGRLAVTVVLPPELVREYCHFLQSFTEFFSLVHRKHLAAAAERRAASRSQDPQLAQQFAAYQQRLVSSYDAYTSAGLQRQQAIKSIAADLRRESHPWCTADVVRLSLAAAGRSGQRGRPRAARPEQS
jgi:hypothetical protein